MLKLYQAFEDSKPDFTAAGLEPVAFIDRFRGQPLNPEQYEYFPLPAIFIGRSIQWVQAGNVYNGALMLDFHLVSEPTWEMSNISTNREEGLKYYRWVNQVRKVLDKFSSEETANLQRSNDREIDTGVTIYEVIAYTTTLYAPEDEQEYTTPENLEEQYTGLVTALR